jgi:hypothetical protein
MCCESSVAYAFMGALLVAVAKKSPSLARLNPKNQRVLLQSL